MAIYRMVGNKEDLTQVPVTSFGQTGVLERQDLQRILRGKPEILEEGLFVITEEFGNWTDSNRRIDLLCLDADGRLVVIELKRGETGEHMDLQAIRYAAMASTMTLQQAIDTHQAYLNKWDIDEDAEGRITEYLENHDALEFSPERPRIVLVSEGFSSELTTCVLWLNRSGLDVTCIRMQPYQNGAELLIETSQVIPLPEASDYLVRIREREDEVQKVQRQRSGPGQTTPSGDVFKESIARAQEQHQPGLQRLFDCAIDLEDAGLVELSTRINGKGDHVWLHLSIPGKGQNLVSFSNLLHKGGRGGEINFWPGWEDIAPDALLRIDELIGEATSNRGERHRRLSRKPNLDSILPALTAAYQEAKDKLAGGGDGE